MVARLWGASYDETQLRFENLADGGIDTLSLIRMLLQQLGDIGRSLISDVCLTGSEACPEDVLVGAGLGEDVEEVVAKVVAC